MYVVRVTDGSKWRASAMAAVAIDGEPAMSADSQENESAQARPDVGATRRSRMDRLYSENAAELGRLAYLLTGDRELAADLAQESLARAFGRLGQLRHWDRFDAYARRILVNLVRKRWRRAAHERDFLAREGRRVAAQPVVDPADVIADVETLWAAMLRLPERQRSAIVLRYYVDLSERATAEALGCRVGTVKSLVHRGLATMRTEIEADDE